MYIILLLPVFLSALLLGAHFIRSGSILLAVPALLFPFLLFIRRAWAARLVQLILAFGLIEWVITLLHLVAERCVDGQPWIRLTIILGSVAAFTGGSALLFSFSRTLRRRYGLGTDRINKRKQ